MKKQRREDTERTWTRLGATRAQAQRLLGIRRVTLTDEEVKVALDEHRASNMWFCAIDWLDAGFIVVRDGLFYRSLAPPQPGGEP